jgi:phage tail-like protein
MAQNNELFRNYGFFLELQGERAGYFMTVCDIGLEVECIEYREGCSPSPVRKLPGRTRVRDVKLSSGITQSDALWRWLDSAVQGKVETRDVSIVVLGSDGQTEVARWNLGNAWIRECRIKEFNALGNDIAIQHITLAADSLERAALERAPAASGAAA